MPRVFVDHALAEGAELDLPPGAARHVQVLRLQPGQAITLFNGQGGEWPATITRMGRSDVGVRLQAHEPLEREPSRRVHLAVGMPANERMDWLVEKAAELGATSLQPLHTAHSVLRLSGDRAPKKQQHWQQVAVAACEQCGGNRVPAVHPVQDLSAWLSGAHRLAPLRCVLSLAEGTQPLATVLAAQPLAEVLFLSGPEGGLSPAEEAQARAAGFVPVTLGPRVLRAETAALAALVQALA
jgi:16S rRNA (uracil1498-N3)-methyltransferase